MGAFELFEQIRAAGWAGLETWKTEREPETFELEFKGKGNDAPKLSAFDKENIGKAVSGFANMSGGVLVIGIDTAKQDGVDRVDQLRPTKNLAAYVDAINRHLAVCTDPRVPGAHAVPIERADDEGIVALYVPASDGGPHRAKGGPAQPTKTGERCINDLYYTRQGVQTLVLEHSLLAAMFGRLPPPVLEVDVNNRDGEIYEFRVRNRGRGIARHVLLRVRIECRHGDNIVPLNSGEPSKQPGWARVLRRSSAYPDSWAFVFDGVIYGDDEVTALYFDLGKMKNTPWDTLRAQVRVDAEGMAPARFELKHPPAAS